MIEQHGDIHSMSRTDALEWRVVRDRGFTLFEMLVAATVLAIIAATVAPMFSDDDRLHVMAASSVLASDLEMAQVMTISYPNQPVVVRFDAANQTYWLAYASDPDTPLTRSDTGEPYQVILGQGRASSAQGVTMTLAQVANDTVQFNALGGLTDFSTTPMIELDRGSNAITVSISPMTGTVKTADGTIGGN